MMIKEHTFGDPNKFKSLVGLCNILNSIESKSDKRKLIKHINEFNKICSYIEKEQNDLESKQLLLIKIKRYYLSGVEIKNIENAYPKLYSHTINFISTKIKFIFFDSNKELKKKRIYIKNHRMGCREKIK